MTNTQLLHEIASRLYDAPDHVHFTSMNQIRELWLAMFTKEELISLWDDCKNDLDIGYDDEVYEVLNAIGYFNEEVK